MGLIIQFKNSFLPPKAMYFILSEMTIIPICFECQEKIFFECDGVAICIYICKSMYIRICSVKEGILITKCEITTVTLLGIRNLN